MSGGRRRRPRGVLPRASLTPPPLQAAADLAAYFSPLRRHGEVEVMYTDSRRLLLRPPPRPAPPTKASHPPPPQPARSPTRISVPVSRHVAKRGGRVGQLKDGKKIGLLTGHPERAALLARIQDRTTATTKGT